MTYGELKQFEKDCIFKTEIGNFDCRQIRLIDSRIRFNCADMLNTIKKLEGKSHVD